MCLEKWSFILKMDGWIGGLSLARLMLGTLMGPLHFPEGITTATALYIFVWVLDWTLYSTLFFILKAGRWIRFIPGKSIENYTFFMQKHAELQKLLAFTKTPCILVHCTVDVPFFIVNLRKMWQIKINYWTEMKTRQTPCNSAYPIRCNRTYESF